MVFGSEGDIRVAYLPVFCSSVPVCAMKGSESLGFAFCGGYLQLCKGSVKHSNEWWHFTVTLYLL